MVFTERQADGSFPAAAAVLAVGGCRIRRVARAGILTLASARFGTPTSARISSGWIVTPASSRVLMAKAGIKTYVGRIIVVVVIVVLVASHIWFLLQTIKPV